MIRNSIADGKKLQRVHVVVEPPTDYIRYELMWSYAPNVAAGEDIRILPTPPGQWPDLPRRDYWLFDSRDLWAMAYDGEGRFLYAELVTDPAEIVRHAYWRDAALHHAISYQQYLRLSADRDMRLNELPVTTFLTGLLFKGHAFGAPGLTAWTWLRRHARTTEGREKLPGDPV